MGKKKTKHTLIISVIILVLLLGIGSVLYFTGVIPQLTVSSTFTPIYCNDYTFTCCIEQLAYPQQFTIDRDDAFICPLTATKCEISVASYPYYTGSVNCVYKFRPLMFGSTWKCDDESLVSANKQINVYSGDYVYTTGQATPLSIKVYERELIFTGRSGSTVGEPVVEADGCTFNPTATYNKDGELVDYEVTGTSYTVPMGQCTRNYVPGDRHICGNVEEQCSQDSDCNRHTYGNYECTGRQLQEYGCKELSLPSYLEKYSNGYAYKPFSGTSESGTVATLSRCEIKSNVAVQCCGDNDCGTNAFCDTGNTWTCKETVDCIKDSDCGTSVQKDFTIPALKTPACKSGKCDFTEEKVECVGDTNCPSGSYCGTDYKCKQSTIPRVECPNQCCSGMEDYFDKPCATGLFCIGGNCVSEGCKANKDCPAGQVCSSGDCIDEDSEDGNKNICKWYQNYYAKDKGFFARAKEGCKLNAWVVIVPAIVFLILLGVGIFFINKKLSRRR